MRQRGLNDTKVLHKAYLKDSVRSPRDAGTPIPAPWRSPPAALSDAAASQAP